MCGIIGGRDIERSLTSLCHRGSSTEIREFNSLEVGHVLHSVVGRVAQPLEKDEKYFTGNCEIYNWKELANKYSFDVENDAELFFELLCMKGLKALKEVEGVYAISFYDGDDLFITRDLMGVCPLWYSNDEDLLFASERKTFEDREIQCRELNPRRILKYNFNEKKWTLVDKKNFFEINIAENKNQEEFIEEIRNLFLESVRKRVPDDGEVALLFSGGLDSTLIAAALEELGVNFTCYTSGLQFGNVNKPRDLEWSKRIAQEHDWPLEFYEPDLGEVEEMLPDIVDWISSTNYVKISVALPIHFSLNKVKDEKVVMSGLGSEQLYAGYKRQQNYLNKECLSDLRSMYHRDLYRDNVICFRNGVEIRLPFLDHELIENSLTIPSDLKRKDDYRKWILRKVAETFDMPEEVVWRKKVAAQYGSNYSKGLDRIASKNDFTSSKDYLNSFREQPNKRLVGLSSGGKDSNAAIYRALRRKNSIKNLLNVKTVNKESYMFDSKDATILENQSEKLGVPLIVEKSPGEKEEELEELKSGLQKSIDLHDVEGVVCGAIASTYQRDRVEKVCDELGLKVFTPLWRENQSNYLRWLIREGFEVKITSVAARGLDDEWVNKVLDKDSIEELIALSKKYGFNAAGEGGEFETVVTGFPNKMIE